ncbi:hypothetical protein [Lactobacillus terrae]|uniref:hypothetical protein n=1 Tax=Lactobacillus terrae TaxID=2269374 RepID=UPI000C1B6353|nr:hypothetical protein [Lactobacillus terrae]
MDKAFFIMLIWGSLISITFTAVLYIITDNLIGRIILIMIGIFQIFYSTYRGFDYYKSFIRK